MTRSILGRFTVPYQTQTADTIIADVIPPKSGLYTVLNTVAYTNSSTAHTLTVMRSQGSTTTTAAAAASQAVINVASLSLAKDMAGNSLAEDLAANDFLVIAHSDGTYGVYKISSISSLAITLTSNLTQAVASGAIVYGMYELGRTTGIKHLQFTLPASATTYLPNNPSGNGSGELGIAQSKGVSEPLVVHSGNATAAGKLLYAQASYQRYA